MPTAPTTYARPPITHHLKSWPEPFAATWSGKKQYDLRNNDRDFRVGDYLLLQEWNNQESNEKKHYTGRCIMALVTYMTPGGHWDLPVNLCVLGIEIIDKEPGREE